MTQEDRQLLIKDLASRIPYNVVVENTDPDDPDVRFICYFTGSMLQDLMNGTNMFNYKPYLRSMDEMTAEEVQDFHRIIVESQDVEGCSSTALVADWNYKKHFDVHGLIPQGLAIKVTLDNDPYILPKDRTHSPVRTNMAVKLAALVNKAVKAGTVRCPTTSVSGVESILKLYPEIEIMTSEQEQVKAIAQVIYNLAFN